MSGHRSIEQKANIGHMLRVEVANSAERMMLVQKLG
jgi:hypothetical protein